MEYAVVKVPGDSDIMGRVALLDSNHIQLEDPVYITIRPSVTGSLAVGMQRATLFAAPGNHLLLLDFSKVLSYYKPSDGVIKYYKEIIQTYQEHHDLVLDDQLNDEEEVEHTEDSEEFVRTLSEFLNNRKNANTAYH
jgi:hypothetical protein